MKYVMTVHPSEAREAALADFGVGQGVSASKAAANHVSGRMSRLPSAIPAT